MIPYLAVVGALAPVMDGIPIMPSSLAGDKPMQHALGKAVIAWAERNPGDALCSLKAFGVLSFIATHWGPKDEERWTAVIVFHPDDRRLSMIGTADTAAEALEVIFKDVEGFSRDVVKHAWLKHILTIAKDIEGLDDKLTDSDNCILALEYLGPDGENRPLRSTTQGS